MNDLVLLDRKHLNLEAYNSFKHEKLLPRFIGPFQIKRVVSSVVYELYLPKNVNAHPVVAEDSRAHERPEPDIVDSEEESEIEEIVDSRTRRKRKEYLVKWRGFPHDENEWLPVSKLKNATDMIKAYHSRKKV